MANKLIVSYTVAWDDESSYTRIQKALHEAIVAGVPRSSTWLETTSFYVIETSENSHEFTKRVTAAAKMRPAKDKLLVINMNQQGGAAWGAITDPDIYSLLPFVKKL